jgi:hypothetical protein
VQCDNEEQAGANDCPVLIVAATSRSGWAGVRVRRCRQDEDSNDELTHDAFDTPRPVSLGTNKKATVSDGLLVGVAGIEPATYSV